MPDPDRLVPCVNINVLPELTRIDVAKNTVELFFIEGGLDNSLVS